MKAAVIGASGYLGAELLRLLAGHPQIEVASIQGDSSAGRQIASLYPGLASAYHEMPIEAASAAATRGCEVVFVAVPSGRSQEIVHELVGGGSLVVDLGADFRLRDPELYQQWYRFTHRYPELLARAVYGLPELNRKFLPSAELIAAPGCYVTAASIALAPLIARGLIEKTGIIVDAASGTSGGGREPQEVFQHAKVNENFTAYGVLTHRHTPEIEQTIGGSVLFTPHLAPMTRGILATCYVRPTRALTTASITAELAAAYEEEPFVQVVDEIPATRETYGSNNLRLAARVDERSGYAIVFSAIDNLTKGGAGQALQAANVALGLEETMGLPRVALLP